MSIIRTHKNGNYTVLCNSIFRDKSLSLKAKGLLAEMLSCSDNWQFSVAGLVGMNKEGKDAINAALHELEKAGYLKRTRDLSKVGTTNKYIYDVYESPQMAAADAAVDGDTDGVSSSVESALEGNDNISIDASDSNPVDNSSRHAENPTAGNQSSENPPERSINTGIITKEKEDVSVSTNPSTVTVVAPPVDEIRSNIKNQIAYDDHVNRFNCDLVDNLVSVMTEMKVFVLNGKLIKCGGDVYPPDLVLVKLDLIEWDHIEYIMECLNHRKDENPIHNIKAYLRASLLNAPDTIDAYYSAAVQHDMQHGL